MKNRIICVVACMMMLAGCLGLCSCGNYRVFDTTFTYSWAQIKLPDGTIVQGKWTTGLTTKAISCKSRLTVPHIWFMQRMLL